MNKLKNKIKRINDELKIFLKLIVCTNIFNAIIVFVAKILNHNINKSGRNERKIETKILLKKHSIIKKFLLDQFKDYIKNYKLVTKRNEKNMEKTIWICWWQGLDNAPDIVKACVNSLKKSFNDYNIIVIDDSNYKKYINVPKWIEDKKNKNKISKTHFSDFLRIELLAEHGGIWLDSTFYCSKTVSDDFFDSSIWSIKRPNYGHLSPACGFFANHSLGCKYESKAFFEVLSDYVCHYWKENDYVIDYLLTDYLIDIVLDNNPEFQILFDNIKSNNKNCDELFKYLGKKYDEKKWNELKEETFLFKLSWKHSFDKKINNNDTFYKKILDNEL